MDGNQLIYKGRMDGHTHTHTHIYIIIYNDVLIFADVQLHSSYSQQEAYKFGRFYGSCREILPKSG